MPNVIQAIFLGFIQGLTEFIPVSSSGHLDILPRLFGWESPNTTFILFLHLGTLISLVVYFRYRLWEYVKSIIIWVRAKGKTKGEDRENMRLISKILLATIPAGLIGLILEDTIEKFYTTQTESNMAPVVTLTAMMVMGFMFVISPKLFTGKKHNLDKLSYRSAIAIGFAQAAALLRGVSRSGITIFVGQGLGLSRVAAAEFSFLLSIPIITATSLLGIYQLLQLPPELIMDQLQINIIGAIAAMVSGFIAIKFMLSYLQDRNLSGFGWYRIIFAAVSLFLLLIAK